MLENLQPRKFNRNYVEKFVNLLHDSKQLNPKYSIQRKKLKLKPIKIMKTDNSNNIKNNGGIYITKLDENNNQYPNINNMLDNNEEYTNNFSDYFLDEEQNNYNDNNYYNNNILTDTVRGILNKEKDSNINLELNEEKEKLLYEILKTKNKFHKNNRYNKFYSPTEVNESKEDNNINNNKKRKIYFSPNFVRNFDNNLAKSIEKQNFKKLTKNQVKNLYYISELKVFESVDEMKKKNKILNQIKNNQKRRYLNDIDIFKYDKKKWDKKREELNKNINEIMFNKFNLENKKYLRNMRKSVDKLHDNAQYIESDLGKLFTDLNIFIDKNSEYIKENSHSNKESSIHSKRSSFVKKQRLSLKNPKPITLQDT